MVRLIKFCLAAYFPVAVIKLHDKKLAEIPHCDRDTQLDDMNLNTGTGSRSLLISIEGVPISAVNTFYRLDGIQYLIHYLPVISYIILNQQTFHPSAVFLCIFYSQLRTFLEAGVTKIIAIFPLALYAIRLAPAAVPSKRMDFSAQEIYWLAEQCYLTDRVVLDLITRERLEDQLDNGEWDKSVIQFWSCARTADLLLKHC